MKEEVWKTIPEYEGLYMVSDIGRVKRLKRGYLKDDKILVNQVDVHGYERVSLSKSRKVRTISIHRLMGMAFLQYPIPDKLEVCHNDGNRRNNVLGNLRIDTKLGNQRDKLVHGTSTRGERSASNKLSESEVLKIFNDPRSHPQIAKDHKVTAIQICYIKNGKSWSWLTGKVYQPPRRVNGLWVYD